MPSRIATSTMMNEPASRPWASGAPAWVYALMGQAPGEHSGATDDHRANAGTGDAGADDVGAGGGAWGDAAVVTRGVRGGKQFALASVVCVHAADDDLAALQRRTTVAYGKLAEALAPLRPRQVVRVWNHIPDILSGGEAPGANCHQQPGTRRINRYMAFNAGRYAAYQRWYGPGGLADSVPTASGVGMSGGDMIIHALAAEQGGAAIANPRQIAPYHYSRRYGPVPPCFSRATVLRDGEETLLLAGGTSSVHGEESVYCGDLEAQARETFINLAALISTAREEPVESQLKPATAKQLQSYRDLRIYHVHPQDRTVLEHMIADWFGGLENIEFVRADLCRRDLLVEIEGLAQL